MPTPASSTLWPDHAGVYTDPISDVPPLNISCLSEVQLDDENEQHPLITVRLALARAGSPKGLYASEAHFRRIGWVLESLDDCTTSVLIMDRTDRSTFPAHIPGPGELRLQHNLLVQCGMAPDYLILPWEEPKRDSILLFDSASGISSCRDYVILGPWCIGCQTVVKTKGNMCDECTEEMWRETQLPLSDATLQKLGETRTSEAALTILLTAGPSCTPPDALDNSYQG